MTTTLQQLWSTFCEKCDILPWFASGLSEHDRNVYQDFRFSYLKLRSACHLFAETYKVRLHEQRQNPALTNWFNCGAASAKCQELIATAMDVESLAQHFSPHAVRRSRWRQSKILSLTLLLSISLPVGYFYKYMLLSIWGWFIPKKSGDTISTATTSDTSTKLTKFPVTTLGLVLLMCAPLFATRFARSEVESVPTYTAKLLGLLRSLHKLLEQSSLQTSQLGSRLAFDNIEILLDNLINCGPLDPDNNLLW